MKPLAILFALLLLVAFTAPADACPLQQQFVSSGCHQVQMFAQPVQAFIAPQFVQSYAVQPVVQQINVQPQLIVRQRIAVVRPVRQRIVIRTGGIF